MNDQPSDQNLSPELPTSPANVPAAKGRWLPCGCWTWGFTGFAVFILAGIVVPSTGQVQVRGSQTKALAQAKQIGLALRLFADDHDGNYPRQGVPAEVKDAPQNANEAFAVLFPDYTQSESIFGNKLCAYQTRTPDNVLDHPFVWKPVKTLQAGENVYGYVMGLTAKSPPEAPIIVDGTDGTGHYNSDPRRRGGVWKGQKAVVIRLDNSGALENLAGPVDQRFIPRRVEPAPDPTPGAEGKPYVPRRDLVKNLLDVDYLGKDVRYLDPAR